jgi:dienelactone hydrolase
MTPSRKPGRNPRLGVAAVIAALLVAAPPPATGREAPPEPEEEVEAFIAAGAAGTLILPAGAPDRRTPAVVILQDGAAPDGRAGLYADQLLGAGLAVLEVVRLPGDSLTAVLAELARHPRLAGQGIGLLGFGEGARQAAMLSLPGVAARALLYPACAGLAPPPMPGEAVLLMHGDADLANPPQPCAALGAALARTGARLRLRVLPGAGYAWDRPAFSDEGRAMLPRPDGQGRVAAQAWPAMTALSATEVAGFFAASLLGPRP